MNNFIIAHGTDIAIALRSISFFIVTFLCLPSQLRETTVHNGLKKLRLQLIVLSILLALLNLVSLTFLFSILDVQQKITNATLHIINGVAFLAIAIINYLIYHQQYTTKNKAFHKQVEKLENKKGGVK